MRKLKLEIYVNGMFYGLLRSNLQGGGGIFPIYEEEIHEEVEKRLPLLKGKKYNVSIL